GYTIQSGGVGSAKRRWQGSNCRYRERITLVGAVHDRGTVGGNRAELQSCARRIGRGTLAEIDVAGAAAYGLRAGDRAVISRRAILEPNSGTEAVGVGHAIQVCAVWIHRGGRQCGNRRRSRGGET